MYTTRHANRCAPAVRYLAILKLFNPRRLKAAMVVLKLRAGPAHSRPPATQLLVARSLEISCFVLRILFRLGAPGSEVGFRICSGFEISCFALRISLRHFAFFGFWYSDFEFGCRHVVAKLTQFCHASAPPGREFPAFRPPVACIIDEFCN
jgi:hypothetical protein